MKYLFITLDVQDGERKHTHRILHTTNAKNIEFAAQRYVANFWGYGERQNKEDDFWWFFGEITCRLYTVVEISEYEYNLMSAIFSGRTESKNYFEIVHTGHCEASQREEIQIHAGENGNIILYQDADKLGFIVDVYGQNDLANTMTVWEDDIKPAEDEPLIIHPSDEEIREFKEAWGQGHREVCSQLGYSYKHSESDELLMVDFFWIEKDKKWYNKESSLFTPREQLIADYLRHKEM